jgi:hypothetical protein
VERAMAYGPLAALDDRPRPGKEPTITPEAKAWFTFTPEHGSWLNLIAVVLMSPFIGRHKMRASWKGHVNLPITIRGPPCGPLKIPEVSVCCTPLQRLQRQLA